LPRISRKTALVTLEYQWTNRKSICGSVASAQNGTKIPITPFLQSTLKSVKIELSSQTLTVVKYQGYSQNGAAQLRNWKTYGGTLTFWKANCRA
jgi:hypothetical protein